MESSSPRPTLGRVLDGMVLPQFLSERVRVCKDGQLSRLGTDPPPFVLYIASVTLRADENPALDLAIHLSKALSVPLLAHALYSDRWPHSTARRAAFVIDSVREMQGRLAARGVPFTFQFLRSGARQPLHMTLASRAVAIVTDEPFVQPYLGLVRRLAGCGAPLVTVDTACVLPAQLTAKGDCNRAFRFRAKTDKQRRVRLSASYPPPPELDEHFRRGALAVKALLQRVPTSPMDTAKTTADWISESKVDTSVRPLASTPGGRTAALRRWESFRKAGLARYAKCRNDPLKHHKHGVSRMSAYLNMGVISPFRVGRDVAAALSRGGGAAKFLDEFGVWRELAYAFCFHTPNHLDARTALPGWAYKTLSEHASDARNVLPLDTMARAATGQTLWDLAQLSLVLNGELHNNLRMTWGKEIIRWTRGPDEAYKALCYLNDHFAIDGLAPPSYAGLLWCLGWADGPKQESRCFGRVRSRSAASIARRYDLGKLKTQIMELERTAGYFMVKKRPAMAADSETGYGDPLNESLDSSTPRKDNEKKPPAKRSRIVAWLKSSKSTAANDRGARDAAADWK